MRGNIVNLPCSDHMPEGARHFPARDMLYDRYDFTAGQYNARYTQECLNEYQPDKHLVSGRTALYAKQIGDGWRQQPDWQPPEQYKE